MREEKELSHRGTHIDFKEVEREIDVLLSKTKDAIKKTPHTEEAPEREKPIDDIQQEVKTLVVQRKRELHPIIEKIRRGKIKIRIKKRGEERKTNEENRGGEERKETETINKTVKEHGVSRDGKHSILVEEASEDSILIDEDLKKFLSIVDNLLGKLPEDVIREFAESEDFIIYERVMRKYNG